MNSTHFLKSFFAYLPISFVSALVFSCVCRFFFFFTFFQRNQKKRGGGIVYQMSIAKRDLIPLLPEIGHFLNFTKPSSLVVGGVYCLEFFYFVKN